MSKKKTIPGRW